MAMMPIAIKNARYKQQFSRCRGHSMQSQELHYSLVIEWDPQDNIYVVTVPELTGCATHGHTYDEAIHQAQDAIASWIDAATQVGVPIPAPRVYAPASA